MSSRYWLATWDWDSWLVYQGLEPSTIGLRRKPDIAVGDVFLNYVRHEGKVPGQWVSAEQVVEGYRYDETRIYPDGVWPHRWLVKPISPRYVAGDGVVAKEYAGAMELFRGAPNWGSYLMMPGREIPQHDGQMLLDLLNANTPADPAETAPTASRAAAASTRSAPGDRRAVSLALRYRILKRDGFKCVKCGRSPATDPGVELHVDHIVPRARGGETSDANLQTLCASCNLGKSDHDD